MFCVEQHPLRPVTEQALAQLQGAGQNRYPKPMNPQIALKQFGLNDKEIKVYLALLELGTDTVLNIAKKAKLKRPTAYIVLESLLEKGLVSEFPRKNKTLYMAEAPDLLIRKIKEREKILIQSLPFLKSIYNANEKKPDVRFYEGKEGVETVYGEILSEKKEIIWFGSIEKLEKNFPGQLDLFIKLTRERGIKSREIIGLSKADLNYAKKIKSEINLVRFLPENLHFSINCALFNNKVALISLENDFFAVVIESEKIYQSIKSLFELAWIAAKEI